MRVRPRPSPSPPRPWHPLPPLAAQPWRPVKSAVVAAAALLVRYTTIPRLELLNPTKRCCGVAASSVTAAFVASLNCVSRVSPEVLGATRDQSPGSHCAVSPVRVGSHDQSCGPVVVLRAANRWPPKVTMDGTARSAGSRSDALLLASEVLFVYAAALGVASVQSGQRRIRMRIEHCPGVAEVVRVNPLAFARQSASLVGAPKTAMLSSRR